MTRASILKHPRVAAQVGNTLKSLEALRKVAVDEFSDEELYDTRGNYNTQTEIGMLLMQVSYMTSMLRQAGY